jgi:hypothetical protein
MTNLQWTEVEYKNKKIKILKIKCKMRTFNQNLPRPRLMTLGSVKSGIYKFAPY